jgi:hypothetical protein
MKNRSLTDPFAMMMDPQAVLMAVAASSHLQQLQATVYRPLDKPMLPRAALDSADFDRFIDQEPTSFGELSH